MRPTSSAPTAPLAAAAEFARDARKNGFGVLICAAGMAAHLALAPLPGTPPCRSSASP